MAIAKFGSNMKWTGRLKCILVCVDSYVGIDIDEMVAQKCDTIKEHCTGTMFYLGR